MPSAAQLPATNKLGVAQEAASRTTKPLVSNTEGNSSKSEMPFRPIQHLAGVDDFVRQTQFTKILLYGVLVGAEAYHQQTKILATLFQNLAGI